jgi:hypothetical protein
MQSLTVTEVAAAPEAQGRDDLSTILTGSDRRQEQRPI